MEPREARPGAAVGAPQAVPVREGAPVVEETHRRCTSRVEPALPLVHASTVYRWAKSPFAVWCDHHAPEDERDPPSLFDEMLRKEGIEHERAFLQSEWPDVEPLAYESEEEGFRAALDAMAAGAPVLHGAPLMYAPEGLAGRADVLERVDGGASVFGSYHYVVKEVKLARNLRREHRLQALFYNHVLGRIQGYTPENAFLVNRDRDVVAVPHESAPVHEAVAAVRALIDDREGRLVRPAYKKGVRPWESYTNRQAVARRCISVVDGVGAATQLKLVERGFDTFDALAAAQEAALVALPGIGPTTAQRILLASRALVEARHIRKAPFALEPCEVEVFFDLEGTGEQEDDDGLRVEIDYLIGSLVRWPDGREEYVPFVAHTLEDEGRMFREFCDWFAKLPDCRLYHWHHYEKTHLKRLVQRHGCDADVEQRLMASLVDLHKVTTRAFAFPTYGTSIKQLAPYMGFQWRHKDVNAMESIALYVEYARGGDRDKLQRVLDYNEDDCVATRVVKDWLLAEDAPS